MDGDLIYASAVGRPESDRAEARGPSEAAGSMPGRTRHGQGGNAAALRLEARAGPIPAKLHAAHASVGPARARPESPSRGKSRGSATRRGSALAASGRGRAQGMSGTAGTGRAPSGRKISFLLSPSQPKPQLVFDVP